MYNIVFGDRTAYENSGYHLSVRIGLAYMLSTDKIGNFKGNSHPPGGWGLLHSMVQTHPLHGSRHPRMRAA
jgi:hypothetical protein